MIRGFVQEDNVKLSTTVKVVLDIEKDDDWWVHGQPGAVRRIVMNMFANSLKYTNEGTIRVSLNSDGQTNKTRRLVCIAVADTGIGMKVSAMGKRTVSI